jgi:hypothetical protein
MKQDGQFLLFTREEFKDWLLKTQFTRKIKSIQQHNTANPDYSNFKNNNHFQLLQGMKNAHINRGFSDIAQNITIFPDSIIAICRDFNQDPAGIYGWNKNSICIENLGWFDIGQNKMTEEQKKSIIFVTALLCIKFNLVPNINTILYHRWFSEKGVRINNGTPLYKTCPGNNFFGGHTIESAKKNFIPLILREIKIMNLPQAKQDGLNALEYLKSRGRIIDITGWTDNIIENTTPNLEWIFIKWMKDVEMLTK